MSFRETPGSFPTDYTVVVVISLRYDGDNTTDACLEDIEKAVSRDIHDRMHKSCSQALERGDIRMSPIADRDIFTSSTPFAVVSTG